MRFSLSTAAVAAAVSGCAAAKECPTTPIEGPFLLTIVMKEGSVEYATNVARVSRGVPILNPTYASNETFTWNTTENRVHWDGEFYRSAKVSEGGAFYFWSEGSMPDDGEFVFKQVVSDCAVYIVSEGSTEADGIYQWTSNKPDKYPSSSSWSLKKPGNSAIRVDVPKSG